MFMAVIGVRPKCIRKLDVQVKTGFKINHHKTLQQGQQTSKKILFPIDLLHDYTEEKSVCCTTVVDSHHPSQVTVKPSVLFLQKHGTG